MFWLPFDASRFLDMTDVQRHGAGPGQERSA